MNFKTKFFSLIALLALQLPLIAQDELIDIDLDIGTKAWYENTYLWLAVGAFIIILAVLSRRKK